MKVQNKRYGRIKQIGKGKAAFSFKEELKSERGERERRPGLHITLMCINDIFVSLWDKKEIRSSYGYTLSTWNFRVYKT
jgi:hypothetical protein